MTFHSIGLRLMCCVVCQRPPALPCGQSFVFGCLVPLGWHLRISLQYARASRLAHQPNPLRI
jgi:hypothetical protein